MLATMMILPISSLRLSLAGRMRSQCCGIVCSMMSVSSASTSPCSSLATAILVRGTVQHGYGRGSKQLGFPTANLPHFHTVLSEAGCRAGVYCGWCQLPHEPIRPCVTNIGLSPTFKGLENAGLVMETVILDRPAALGDFYGEALTLLLTDFLRTEEKFSSLADLIHHIENDVVMAKQRVKEREDFLGSRLAQLLSSLDDHKEPTLHFVDLTRS